MQKQGLSPTLRTLTSNSFHMAFYVTMSYNKQRKFLAYLHSYPLLSCVNVSLKVPIMLQAELSCSMQKEKASTSDTFGQSTHSHI